MIALPSFLLAVTGLGLLCLSLHRHAAQAGLALAIGRRRIRIRTGGWAMLVLALLVRLPHARWHFALVEWIAQAGLAAGCIVMILSYRPRLLPLAIFVAAALAIILQISVCDFTKSI